MLYKIITLNVWVRYFVWNFKYSHWNSTKELTHVLKEVDFIHVNVVEMQDLLDLRAHKCFWNALTHKFSHYFVSSHYVITRVVKVALSLQWVCEYSPFKNDTHDICEMDRDFELRFVVEITYIPH